MNLASKKRMVPIAPKSKQINMGIFYYHNAAKSIYYHCFVDRSRCI